MATRIHVTPRSYNHEKPGLHENNIAPSQTIPEQTMTMRELLARYQQGLEPSPFKKLEYFDVDEIENINRFFAPGALDLTDIDALNEQVYQLQQTVEKVHERAVKERDRKAQEEKERNERLDQLDKQSPKEEENGTD